MQDFMNFEHKDPTIESFEFLNIFEKEKNVPSLAIAPSKYVWNSKPNIKFIASIFLHFMHTMRSSNFS